MILTKEILDDLVEKAKFSERLRMNLDMRTPSSCSEQASADNSQRMLNAIEPGSVVPIHRHTKSTETVCVLRGAIRQTFFEEVDSFESASVEGFPMAQDANDVTKNRSLRMVEQYVIETGSQCPMYVVPAGAWHTSEALVSGTIIFESKDGKYGEDGSEIWANG